MIASIEAILLKSHIQWAGYVSRMEDHYLPKITLYGGLSTDHSERETLQRLSASPSPHVMSDHLCWSDMAADRDTWRRLIFNAVNEFEEDKKCVKRQENQKES